MKKKLGICSLLLLTLWLGVSCTFPDDISEGYTVQYPFWFSIKNSGNTDITVKLIMGTVPTASASYADFAAIPDDIYKAGQRTNLSAIPPQTIQLSPGSIGAVSTDLDLPVVRNLSIYEEYLKGKLLTFVLEISSGTNTVRAAGWDLPETEWTANNIASAGWGVWNTGEWGSAGHMSQEEKARVRPRLYISWDGTRWVHYPDSTTTAYFIEFGSPDAKQKINLNWVETYSPTYDLEGEAELTWRIEDETAGGSAQNT